MPYKIEYLASVVRSDLSAIDPAAKKRIRKAIEEKLASHPIEFGKPLRYSLKGARSLRIGDFRIIFTIEPPDTVLIVKIGHRSEVYGD